MSTKRCHTCQEIKPLGDFSKRTREADGLQRSCRPCCAVYAATWRATNLERKRAMDREYAAQNAERAREKTRKWAADNPERKKASNAAWRQANAEVIKKRQASQRRLNRDQINERNRQWRINNPERAKERGRASRRRNHGAVLADRALRKARKRQATPLWLTAEQRIEMRGVYICAASMTENLGETFHVDHIVPIGGENVCGLHVPWNLQILPARENILKSNKLG